MNLASVNNNLSGGKYDNNVLEIILNFVLTKTKESFNIRACIQNSYMTEMKLNSTGCSSDKYLF